VASGTPRVRFAASGISEWDNDIPDILFLCCVTTAYRIHQYDSAFEYYLSCCLAMASISSFTVRSMPFLPAQPPTPPTKIAKNINDALRFLNTSFEISLESEKSTQYANLATPPQTTSPSSAVAFNETSPRREPKRIRFVPQPNFCGDDRGGNDASSNHVAFKPILPSRQQKSRKSILKSFDPSLLFELEETNIISAATSPHRRPTFATMLDSVLQQLASPNPESRLDAYRVLTTSLQTYDVIPIPTAMAEKLSLFEQFLRRDMLAAKARLCGIESRLVSRAMKLAAAFLWSLPPMNGFTIEFLSFMIDQSIEILESNSIPKEVVKDQMLLLTMDNLWKNAMTTNQARRILSGLSNIHSRVTGNNVVSLRLLIYNQLIANSTKLMLEKIQEWLVDVFHAMLSSVTEVRSRAIVTGVTAAIKFGPSSHATRAVMDLLNEEIPEGRFYFDHVEERLKVMLQHEAMSQSIPQIWSIVVLFMRSKHLSLVNWPRMTQWLRLLQKCFNSSDRSLNVEALNAWHRMIFVVDPNSTTRLSKIRTLREPIISFYQRRANDLQSVLVTDAAFQCFCTFLYYAFRPSAPAHQLDLYWKELILEVLPKITVSDEKNANRACQALAALFANPSFKVWRPTRATETTKTPISLEELPRLDPQWIRKNIAMVLKPVELIFIAASSPTPSENDSHAQNLWRALLQAISEAGSKEIKSSMDLKNAIAEIVNMLYRVWSVHPSCLGEKPSRGFPIERFDFLTSTTVRTLGPLLFAENILSPTEHGVFVIARPTKQFPHQPKTSGEAPIIAILKLLLRPTEVVEIGDSLRDVAKNILSACLQAQPSRHAKIRLLKICVDVLASQMISDRHCLANNVLYRSIAELTTTILGDETTDQIMGVSQELGHEYRDSIKILTFGLRSYDRNVQKVSKSLYESLVARVRHETGAGGVVLAVTQPLFETFDSNDGTMVNTPAALHFASWLLEAGIPILTQKMLNQAQKALWKHRPISSTEAGHGYFDSFCTMMDTMINASYMLTPADLPTVEVFLSALSGYLSSGRCPSPEALLRRCQSGLALWAKQGDSPVALQIQSKFHLRIPVFHLWSSILAVIERLPRKDSALLDNIGNLICSGFQSRSKSIAGATVAIWNRSFGVQDYLEYPPQLEQTLRRLQPFVDITLPSLPCFRAKGDMQSLSHRVIQDHDIKMFPWLSTDEDLESDLPREATERLSLNITRPHCFPWSALSHLTPVKALRPKSRPHQTHSTRLRHNDSQVEFVAVESSTIDCAAINSQTLTDRQKEVKFRQQAGRVLFHDVRSSPVSLRKCTNKKSSLGILDDNDADDGFNFNNETSAPLQLTNQHKNTRIDSSPLAFAASQATSLLGHHPTLHLETLDGRVDKTATDFPSSPPELDDEYAYISAPEIAISPSTCFAGFPAVRSNALAFAAQTENLIKANDRDLDITTDLTNIATRPVRRPSFDESLPRPIIETTLDKEEPSENGHAYSQILPAAQCPSPLNDEVVARTSLLDTSLPSQSTSLESGISKDSILAPAVQFNNVELMDSTAFVGGLSVTDNISQTSTDEINLIETPLTSTRTLQARQSNLQVIIPDPAQVVRVIISKDTNEPSYYTVTRVEDSFGSGTMAGTHSKQCNITSDTRPGTHRLARSLSKRKAVVSIGKIPTKRHKSDQFLQCSSLPVEHEDDEDDVDEDIIVCQVRSPKFTIVKHEANQ